MSSQNTLSELEAPGALEVVRPDEIAERVAASVMRHLLPRHEARQLGAAGTPTLLRDCLERELRAALRGAIRWRDQETLRLVRKNEP